MHEAERKMNAVACHNPTAHRIRIKPLMLFESILCSLKSVVRVRQPDGSSKKVIDDWRVSCQS